MPTNKLVGSQKPGRRRSGADHIDAEPGGRDVLQPHLAERLQIRFGPNSTTAYSRLRINGILRCSPNEMGYMFIRQLPYLRVITPHVSVLALPAGLFKVATVKFPFRADRHAATRGQLCTVTLKDLRRAIFPSPAAKSLVCGRWAEYGVTSVVQ